MLADLRALGLPELLGRAAELIELRGHCKGVHRNPKTGSLDLVGAVAVACGAPDKPTTLDPHRDVPAANQGRYEAIVELLDALLGVDPEEWNDQATVTGEQAISVLRQTRDRLLIAVA